MCYIYVCKHELCYLSINKLYIINTNFLRKKPVKSLKKRYTLKEKSDRNFVAFLLNAKFSMLSSQQKNTKTSFFIKT